jgi:hypothetical protein
MTRTLAMLCLLAGCLVPCYPQAKETIRISTSVTANEDVQSEFSSNLNAGFRRLGDIVITEEDPMFRVGVVAIKNSFVGGQGAGYVVSVVVTRSSFPSRSTRAMMRGLAKDATSEKMLFDLFGSGVTVVQHFALTGGGNIDDICKRTVAAVDAGPIEDERKQLQEIMDHAKRAKELQKQYPNKSLREIDEMIEAEKRKP